VGELQKNLNKTDYLEVEDFARVDTLLLAARKRAAVVESLRNDELEFKIPIFEDYL
jgi:BMFP domain-containing protein YqiC